MPDVAWHIKQLIAEALQVRVADVALEHPAELSHGDYASNAALVHAKQRGENPRELAERIVAYLHERVPDGVAGIDIAGPGFINFHLDSSFFTYVVDHVGQVGEQWGRNENRVGEKTIVEYTDPNPFKEMHIGHLMSNTVGESISRCIAFSGAEVKRANYQGDVGSHVAKTLWGLQQLGLSADNVEALGKGYAHGATAYKNDPEAQLAIDAVNRAIYERTDPDLIALYETGRSASLKHFETLYERLGTDFDYYFFESETGVLGKELVTERVGTIFEESEGAIVFRGEERDPALHTRVFINAAGLPMYEAKELGLAIEKYNRYPYQRSVVVTGNEITEYFKVLRAALAEIRPDLAERTEHVPHGMLRLTSGKMSSRTGDVITGESLLDDMHAAARAVMEEPDEKIADQIAVAAIKYAVLRQSARRDIVFDPETSLSLQGDSGPYLQYALTRARAVIEKAAGAGTRPTADRGDDDVVELERLLYRFPEVVERATDEYEPHHVATFLTELAGAFNAYYHAYRIADGENPGWRLALTRAFATTMENGLWLLGIEAPKRM